MTIAERPKNISLRAFRVTIDKQPEPVEVTRRKPDGTTEFLGLWTPYTELASDLARSLQAVSQRRETSRAARPAAGTPLPVDRSPDDHFGSPKAAPKPGKRA